MHQHSLDVSLYESLELNTRKYARIYNFIKHYSRPEDLVITYEELLTNTVDTLEKCLLYYEFDIDTNLVYETVNILQSDNVRQLERENKGYFGQPRVDKSHIKNPKIGVWKEYLKPSHIKKIKYILNQYGILLDEFTLDQYGLEKYN